MEIDNQFASDNVAADEIGLAYTTLRRALRPESSSVEKEATWSKRLDQVESKLKAWRAESTEATGTPALSADENGGLVPEGYTRVPEILIEPSAAEVWDVGTDEDIVPEEQPSDTIFPDWYIRSEYGVSPDRIRFVRVRGDSMLPTIAPGQRLVVALLAPGTTLRDSAVYILVGPGGAQVKRLIMEPDHIHVWSDNPDRPRFKVALATFSKDYTVVAVVLEANLKL